MLSRLKLAYEYLPKWLQQGIVEWNKGSLELENNSKVIASATSASGIRGHSINLLFIDELIDNGMDAAGVESALAVLKKMARERNKNIYLISHKDELVGRVNNVLRVVKENGFTSYSNDIDYVEQ